MNDDNRDEEEVDIHKPFTKAERIQQLAEIDDDITTLLTHTGAAVQALAQPTASSANSNSLNGHSAPDHSNPGADSSGTSAAGPPPLDPEERLAAFKTAMTAFTTALHSVDVRLRRQIWGLEEAGIITLKNAADREGGIAATNASAGPGKALGATGGSGSSLEPNGVGNMGNLDVGWLNARSSKVDRDMESELWTDARKLLEGVVEGRVRAGGSGVGLGTGSRGGEGRERDAEDRMEQ